MTRNLLWNGTSPFADQTSRNAELERSECLELQFTLMIFDFHEGRQHNIDDVCVEFCFILELTYSSDFHEGRQYFMLMLVLTFAF